MGLIKDKEEEKSELKTLEPRPNYLEELRKNRPKDSIKKAETIDYEIKKIKETTDIRMLRAKAEQYDEKAKRL